MLNPNREQKEIVKSINFEFLRPHYAELADLGGFAEHYAFSDPAAALVKLRGFAEDMVSALFAFHTLPKEYQSSLNDLLNDGMFREMAPKVVIDKLHVLRIHGNKAAHGKGSEFKEHHSKWLVKEAHSLAQWFFISVCDGSKEVCPEFIELTPEQVDESTQLRKEKSAYLRKLAEQESQMTTLLENLEAARAKAKREEKSADELKAILKKTQSVANVLDFNEETTRYQLIEAQLKDAGWSVGPRGQSTKEVGQEVEIKHQPTHSGLGYADYVLYDSVNGKPLAVIEAKKTVVDARQGQNQALYYANGMEKETGHRPIIFFTNGFDIFIWDDAKKEPPRKIHGFYSQDSLDYLHYQNANRDNVLADVKPKESIVDRMYQIEAIKRIGEKFDSRKRNALLVLATGTGKTRVAIAFSEVMLRARWAKRILFLCDRRELRKQARDAFVEYLPGSPLTYVNRSTAKDTDKRIYVSTYPAMMKCFQNFDVGFFDLIIADESHRSIYNRYKDLFTYFDAYQVGLTATPLKFIARNTFHLFGCEDEDPTANFDYEAAITHQPPFLSRFEVMKHTTKFLRDGIKYFDLDAERRQQLEEQVEDPESVDYESYQVSKAVFNKDTDRAIIRNLMDNGLKVNEGTKLGKSIVFARNHKHALQLKDVFDELYPQYGGKFCAVIDNYEPRAEQLIDDLKTTDGSKDLTIAISVDMLDTGIDIPSVLNLVFAKPVKSFSKFWQMIGRGTRLCEDLFGPGQHKEKFQIFDHWGNFEHFDAQETEMEPGKTKSLLQKLFESRLALAEEALKSQDTETFELATKLIAEDVNALPENTIAVREQWKNVTAIKQLDIIENFAPATRSVLRDPIAGLMQWRNTSGREAAYKFDLLITRLSVAHLQNSAERMDLSDAVVTDVSLLPINLAQVKEKIETINRVKTPDFWKSLTISALERVRCDLRGIIHLKQKQDKTAFQPVMLDLKEDAIEYSAHEVKLDGLSLAAYRQRVEGVFNQMLETNAALKKIRTAKPLSEEEITELAEEIATIDPAITLEDLLEHFPNKSRRIELAIRRVIGMEAEQVNEVFTEFVKSNPKLSAGQIRFLDMLKSYIIKYGVIEEGKLWEAPFTYIDVEGISGVFEDETQIDQLLGIVKQLNFEPRNN